VGVATLMAIDGCGREDKNDPGFLFAGRKFTERSFLLELCTSCVHSKRM
jgi:hypothetical protein